MPSLPTTSQTDWAGIQCRRDSDRPQPHGSTVTLLSGDDEWQLRPFENESPKLLVFLPLVTWNEKWEPEGRLAERWEHSPDYREWTYHLRTDIRWHDGVPVTAHDIQFTIVLLTHPDVGVYAAGTISSTVLDDATITVRYAGSMDSPDPWTVYYPKHLLEDLDPN